MTPFETTGRTFLVSYDVQLEDENSFNSVDIDIEDRFGLVDFEIVDSSRASSFVVTEGAGSYDLVVNVSPDNGATYSVTVEDCGDSTGGPGEPPGDVNDPEVVIKDPVLEKMKMPFTGGMPILLGAGLMLLTSVAIGSRMLQNR